MTETSIVIAGIFALSIGAVLGMLGGGGAILTLPMLVYIVGVSPHAAIATSLFVVGSTSVVGTTLHARRGRVQWRVGMVFGGAAMTGAFAGGSLARFVPPTALLVTFAIVMLVTATAMLRRRAEPERTRPLALRRAVLLGVAVGAVSGLVGAGGGFLIVPSLILFGGLTMRDAIGTSLFVIALQSFAGFAGHLGNVEIDWILVVIVTAASVIGTIGGSFIGLAASPETLRRGFAWLVLAMGAFMIERQLPAAAGVGVGAIMLGSLFFALRSARPRRSTP